MNDSDIENILRNARTIAVIGAKDSGPAKAIPVFMRNHGYDIIPVNPKHQRLFGEKVASSVEQINEKVDIVDIFRRSEAVPQHVDEILAMEPLLEVVWMQLGIRNDDVKEKLQEAGIEVVQDRCLKIEYQRVFS